jgi:hypothetical protein
MNRDGIIEAAKRAKEQERIRAYNEAFMQQQRKVAASVASPTAVAAELQLDAIRQLMADKSYINYSYSWRAERLILPNLFGRTRQGAPGPSVGVLEARRRKGGQDFALAAAGVRLLVEREGQPGAPQQCYVLLRDETDALINSIPARGLYDKLKDQPVSEPKYTGYGTFWWVDGQFSFVGRGARREADDEPF